MAADVTSPGLTTASPAPALESAAPPWVREAAAVALALAVGEEERGVRLAMARWGRGGSEKR
jgi:hypothetical protein